jgi:hypothetical protein
MRLAQLGAGAALSVLCTVVGCSQSPSHGSQGSADARGTTASTEQAIQGGTTDGATHPYAVGVCTGGQKGNCSGFCSGALITPNLVVTARHCVDQTAKIIECAKNPTFGPRHNQMWITTSDNMFQSTVGWHDVDVANIVTTQDNHVCGNDIALLILKTPVAAADATPAIPGVQYPMTDLDRYPSHRVTAIGYGVTGPNETNFTAGIRRIRTYIRMECIPGDELIPCPTDFNDNEFFTGDGTCEGDSGSSAFDDKSVTAGKPLSFGVLSRGGDNANPDAGTAATLCKGALYTRLDKFRDLVIKAADLASKNWTLYPKPVPDWTIYVPPPPDAGAPETGTKKPAPLADGYACDTNDQCKSNVCADTGGGKECTGACDESVVPTTCQDGYVCKSAVCVQDLGGGPVETAAAPSTTTTTSGCSVSGSPGPGSGTGSPLKMLGIAAAGGLALALRSRAGARARRRSKAAGKGGAAP